MIERASRPPFKVEITNRPGNGVLMTVTLNGIPLSHRSYELLSGARTKFSIAPGDPENERDVA